MLRQRNRRPKRDSAHHPIVGAVDGGASEDEHLLGSRQPAHFSSSGSTQLAATNMSTLLRKQPVWLILAVASGSCAAFNGVFAKLTTTALTTSWAHVIAQALSLSPDNKIVEYLIRAACFGLNLLFNLAMWALFTAALTRASSTTRVSVVNVSANFFSTALLGLIIFGERLPPMWWAGAGLLAAGNVVIGRREEAEKPGGTIGLDADEEEVEVLLGEGLGEGDAINLSDELGRAETTKEAVQKGEDIDAPVR